MARTYDMLNTNEYLDSANTIVYKIQFKVKSREHIHFREYGTPGGEDAAVSTFYRLDNTIPCDGVGQLAMA